MRILVVGATGTIGSAVANALAEKHEVLRASRSGELQVDIGDPGSIRAIYQKVGRLDAVVSCAGAARFGGLLKLKDEDFAFTIGNKLIGQVNLVRFGEEHMTDGGVFVLTAGIFSQKPAPNVTAIAMVNGALESFTRAAAVDLPRGIRIVTISPPFIDETARKMGLAKGNISAKDNAAHYVAAIESKETGQVIFPVKP